MFRRTIRSRKPERALDDVQRAPARLVENASEVLAENADHHELHAAEHQHGQHHRRPAHHARAVHHLIHDNVEPEQKAQTRHHEPEVCDRANRQRGKRDKRVDRRFDHLADGP